MSSQQDLLDDFDLITEIAYDLSQQFDGVDTTDRKRKVSTYYLAKTVPECMSLLRIIPGSRFTEEGDLFDFPSFCSISRNLIEAANLHWYYCIEPTDTKLSAFRFDLYDFHDYRTTMQIGKFIGAGSEELAILESKCDSLRTQFKNSESFQNLLPEVQRQILKGRKCSEFSQSEISERRGIDTTEFSGIYKLLSNNTHSTPSAISAVVHTRIHGKGLQDAFTGLVLTYVSYFVAEMVKSIGELWEIQFAKQESAEIIHGYANSLFQST